MSHSTTKFTRSQELQMTDIFQNMVSMARAYNSVFPEQEAVTTGGNDIVRVDMLNETRFNTAISKLIKTGSTILNGLGDKYPGRVYLAGGLVNLAIDPLIDLTNPVFAKSDIDLFILAEPENRLRIIEQILRTLQAENEGIPMCVGVRGSVVYVWHAGFERMIQLVLIDTKSYPTIDSVIKGFDLDNIAVAYDGEELIIQKRAWNAMNTRSVVYRPTSVENDNQVYRMTKTAARGYKIISHATDEDITPSLAQILANKESREYLTVPYVQYRVVHGQYKHLPLQELIDKVTSYYKANSTASELFYVYSADVITRLILPGINTHGISNIANPSEYSSQPTVQPVDIPNESDYQIINIPDIQLQNTPSQVVADDNTYVSHRYNSKVIKLDNIDYFTTDDIRLRDLFINGRIPFTYYANFRGNTTLELNLVQPISPRNFDDDHSFKVHISPEDGRKMKAFVKQFIDTAIPMFYHKQTTRSKLKWQFTQEEGLEDLDWTTIPVSLVRRCRNEAGLAALNNLIKESQSRRVTIQVCCNAYAMERTRATSFKDKTHEVKCTFRLAL